MLRTRSPQSLLQDQLSRLVACLPRVREGQDEAIHDARVVTRRVRETLVLGGADLQAEPLSHVAEVIHRASVALGEARDPDVTQGLLAGIEDRFPTAVPLIATLRRQTARAQQTARRRLIKELETLDLGDVPRLVARAQRWDRLKLPLGHTGWRERLRSHIGERAADVRRSMQHASGVYFPNRSHAARLAMKKLRYALELAQETGAWRTPRAIRRLRKAQDALGQAHDREVLLDRVKTLAQQDSNADRADVESLVAFLEAEILALYRRYLGMRSDITTICNACERAARRRRTARTLLAVGAALPALMLLGRRQAAPIEHTASRSDDLRVSVQVVQ
jgi:CHAD domain-containing protein